MKEGLEYIGLSHLVKAIQLWIINISTRIVWSFPACSPSVSTSLFRFPIWWMMDTVYSLFAKWGRSIRVYASVLRAYSFIICTPYVIDNEYCSFPDILHSRVAHLGTFNFAFFLLVRTFVVRIFSFRESRFHMRYTFPNVLVLTLWHQDGNLLLTTFCLSTSRLQQYSDRKGLSKYCTDFYVRFVLAQVLLFSPDLELLF